MKLPFTFAVVGLMIVSVWADDESTTAKSEAADAALAWISFPDRRLEVRGLPWLDENTPDLWRLPRHAQAGVPRGVWNRAVAPDGGRIRFSSNSSRLAIKVRGISEPKKPFYFDAYVNGEYAGSTSVTGSQEQELRLFEQTNRALKEITIYLPHNQEVRVLGGALDPGAEIKEPPAFALKKPIVCYGSSVLQGTGAAHPAKTYPAILARRLNLDFINLGFGGAGKAEPEVVDLVKQLDGCCFLLDLGKSYGLQPMEPYAHMLDAIRFVHPGVPIFCVTPIYSTKESNESGYRERSENLRALMRTAATERRKAGDQLIFVIEGLELFGLGDEGLFYDPLHPNDEGNERMAMRLTPVVEKTLFGKAGKSLPGK